MNWFTQLFRRGQIYSDLNEEIEEHLAEKVEALVAGGIVARSILHFLLRAKGN